MLLSFPFTLSFTFVLPIVVVNYLLFAACGAALVQLGAKVNLFGEKSLHP